MSSLAFLTTWGQSGASGCSTINHWQLGARKPYGARLFGVFADAPPLSPTFHRHRRLHRASGRARPRRGSHRRSHDVGGLRLAEDTSAPIGRITSFSAKFTDAPLAEGKFETYLHERSGGTNRASALINDSPLEEAVFTELVSEAKFPASWENTGNFRNYVADAPCQINVAESARRPASVMRNSGYREACSAHPRCTNGTPIAQSRGSPSFG
jgi:hypothetical protein